MQIRSLALAIGISFAGTAIAAGGIGSVKIEPAAAKAGQEVKVTVAAEGEAPGFCGLAIDFGDGDSRDIKIDSGEAKFPLTIAKTYAKAGNYSVKAYGKKITTHFACSGKAEAALTVAAPAPAPAATAAAPAAPTCPTGYALKGAVGKAGDYTCKARPLAPTACAAGLEAFAAGDSLGCRKAKGRK